MAPIILHCTGGLPRQFQQAIGVAHEDLAGGRELHAAPLAQEELHRKLLFQDLDARRHTGLRPVQLLGRPHHAAGLNHSPKNLQIREFHTSPFPNYLFAINRFPGALILPRVPADCNPQRASIGQELVGRS
jgi:hypothetical protein